MADEFAEYREYLQEDARIEVGIPQTGGGVFRDWAVILESREDTLLVQISRDVLPANVRVDVGFILDVSVWINRDVYSCSGIVTEKQDQRKFRIRLFGSFTLRERRQFFRIDLRLRIRYAILEDREKADAQRDWEHRKELEHMRFQGYDQIVIAAQQARYTPAIQVEWRDLPLAEINLGGGGICVSFPEKVKPEKFVNLEVHLPLTPPRVIQTVAEVIHVKEPRTRKGGKTVYPAGMQFLFLDERDRDLLFGHISAMQIENLRKHAERRGLPREAEAEREPQPMSRRKRLLIQLAVMLAFLAICFIGFKLLIRYQKETPPNEIGQTYENALKKYRHEKH